MNDGVLSQRALSTQRRFTTTEGTENTEVLNHRELREHREKRVNVKSKNKYLSYKFGEAFDPKTKKIYQVWSYMRYDQHKKRAKKISNHFRKELENEIIDYYQDKKD